MAATSKDEFVDLYEVLELSTDTDAETIRKRVNELYLEAQQNLDHRNIKKRLQYQQMYEIYLPQARHLLLDPRRRGEYDRYLEAYRTGSKVAPAEQAEHESSAPVGEMSKVDEPPLPGMSEVDPEVVAAERENLWAKWKEGLQIVEEETAAPAPATAAAAPPLETEEITETTEAADAPSTPATPSLPPFARRSAPPPRPGGAAPGTRPAPPPPRAPGSPPPSRPTPPAPRAASRTPSIPGVGVGLDSAEELEKQRELERQREHERQSFVLIADVSQTTGIVWGAIYGCVIFLVGCIGLFFLINSLKSYPLGLSSGMFSGICLMLLLAAAAFGGSFGRRKAQARKEAELSTLSAEEVMRRHGS